MSSNNQKTGPAAQLNDKVWQVLLDLPDKIIKNHETEGLATLVLHDLGLSDRIGFRRACYLIDNPDFGCLKGVACFCQAYASQCSNDPWQNPVDFVKGIEQSSFYGDMQKFIVENVEREQGSCKLASLNTIGTKLGMIEPHVVTWDMRHGNKGILIYEEDEKATCKCNPGLLEKLCALLGLCHL